MSECGHIRRKPAHGGGLRGLCPAIWPGSEPGAVDTGGDTGLFRHHRGYGRLAGIDWPLPTLGLSNGFGGKCGLCSKEIAYYQRIAPSGIFVWLDIATDASPLAAHQISQADALRYLHVRDTAGNWHIGAAAFLVIWQQLRYWRFLAVLVGLPIIRQIAAMVYNRFADYRFAKLAHCQIAQKNLAEAPTR